MKKLALLVLFAIFSLPVSGQSITDYFPVTIRAWKYQYLSGLQEQIVCEGESTVRNTGEKVYVFVRKVSDSTELSSIIYIVEDEYVYMRMESSQRRWLQRNKEFVIVGLPGKEWKFEGITNNKFTIIKTQKSSVSFDNKNYIDCILVIEEWYYENMLTKIVRRYYARNIGLVCETEEGFEYRMSGAQIKAVPEHFIRKLIDYR